MKFQKGMRRKNFRKSLPKKENYLPSLLEVQFCNDHDIDLKDFVNIKYERYENFKRGNK